MPASQALTGLYPLDREELIAKLEVTTDPRIGRHWQLKAPSTGGPRSRPTCSLWLLMSDGQQAGILSVTLARGSSGLARWRPSRFSRMGPVRLVRMPTMSPRSGASGAVSGGCGTVGHNAFRLDRIT